MLFFLPQSIELITPQRFALFADFKKKKKENLFRLALAQSKVSRIQGPAAAPPLTGAEGKKCVLTFAFTLALVFRAEACARVYSSGVGKKRRALWGELQTGHRIEFYDTPYRIFM